MRPLNCYAPEGTTDGRFQGMFESRLKFSSFFELLTVLIL